SFVLPFSSSALPLILSPWGTAPPFLCRRVGLPAEDGHKQRKGARLGGSAYYVAVCRHAEPPGLDGRAPGSEEAGKVLRRQGLAEVIALRHIAAQCLEPEPHLAGLDSLGHHPKAQVLSQVDRGAHDDRVVVLGHHG